MKYKNDTVDNYVKVIGSDEHPCYRVEIFHAWDGYGIHTAFRSDDFVSALLFACKESVQVLVDDVGIELTKRQLRGLA